MSNSSFPKPADANESQWQAVTYAHGHLLIVAGPGTGKTHTLTHRILHLIPRLKKGQKVLAITFTNKAGQEMRDRLIFRAPDAEGHATVGTFHYFCLGLLRQYFSQGLPKDFRVPSPEEIETLSKGLWPGLKTRQRRDVLEKISLWKAKNFDQPLFPELIAYNAALRRRAWLDFDDLLLETVQFLNTHEEILATLQREYPFIFVDEYQDINPIQHRLLKIFAGPTGIVSAIGDPHQAIYGFRGADVKYFASFSADFPGAATLTLSENYRSAQNILSASSQIMASAGRLHVPALTAKIFAEGRLVIHEAPTDKAEAEYVVHSVEKMVGGTSMFSQDSGRTDSADYANRGFGEIAVLFRLNSQRALLEEALNRSGIPYQITEDKTYDNPEDLLANAFKHSPGNDQADKVSLMTLHASKGLEFKTVFIVGCEEGLLPLERQGMTTDKEEERRLFYVGMTRAKEDLFLVRAARRRLYGKAYDTKASEFLTDIKEELKEYEKIEAKVRKRKADDDQLKLFS